MARERVGHPPSYAKAKKMKSLTLHTHDCFRSSLRDCLLFVYMYRSFDMLVDLLRLLALT